MKIFALLSAAGLAVAAPAVAQMDHSRMNHGAGAPGMGSGMGRAMTRAQAEAQVGPMFAMFDANRDGFVTKAEAGARMTALRGQRVAMRGARGAMTAKSNDEHFREMDRDRNGSISRTEFDAHHSAEMGKAGRGEQRAERMEQRAERMERRTERMQRRGAGAGMRGAMMLAPRNFDRVDANRDGRVNIAEARAAHLAMFTAADANRDGTVTADERRNARQQMRAMRQQRRAS